MSSAKGEEIKIHRRSSITENNAILLANKTSERGNYIMVDASIKPPSKAVYLSPKKSDGMELHSYANDESSKVKMINPQNPVELYRDYVGFHGEYFGFYEEKVDFSHIPKDLEGVDAGKINALLHSLNLVHRAKTIEEYKLSWNGLACLTKDHFKVLGFDKREISKIINTMLYYREFEELAHKSMKRSRKVRRESAVKSMFDSTVGTSVSLEASTTLKDNEVLVDAIPLQNELEMPIPKSMYRNRNFYTRKADESHAKYRDNPFYAQNANEFMGGRNFKWGSGDTVTRARWVSSLRSRMHAGGFHDYMAQEIVMPNRRRKKLAFKTR